jgi:hypothetical protein
LIAGKKFHRAGRDTGEEMQGTSRTLTDRSAALHAGRARASVMAAMLALAPLAHGAETESEVKFGGFIDGLAAYTYPSPAHWSRAVARLEGNAAGRISEDVKWKLGARVDVDAVYFGSDFYPDPVKRDQRARFYYRENYLDVSAGDWEFRFGAQHIVWGEVVGLYFADVVSARDMREFLLPSFDIMRIPQWAARAEYFAGDSHLELIWIPVPVFDQIGKPGADFYPAPRIPSPAPPNIGEIFRDPQKPDRDLSNGNYGIRGNTLAAGWDVAAFYYRSFSTSPTFYRVPASTPGAPVVYEPRYDRIWQVGATASKDFGDFVLRAEAIYARGQGYALAEPTGGDGVVKRNTFDYIVAIDVPLPHDTRLNVQAFQRVFRGGGSDLAVRGDGFGASVLISTKLTPALEPQLLWIQNFEDAGGLVRPRLIWYPAKNYTVSAGVDIFTGPVDGFFGRFGSRDRAYAEVRYDF